MSSHLEAQQRCEGDSPDRKRSRRETAAMLADTAAAGAQRLGAPAAVVDPLLSLLWDIRHLEGRVIAALRAMGVDTNCPPVRAAAAVPLKSPADEDALTPPPKIDAEAGVDGDAIAAYATAADASPAGFPRGALDRAAVVEAVLTWVDAAVPATDADERSPASATPAASRRILAGLVAHGDGPALPPLIVTSGEAGPPLALPQERSGRPETEAALRFAPASDAVRGETEGMVSLGSFGTDEVADWGRYAEGLGLAIAEIHPLLHSLCSTTLSGMPTCHAKWIEVAGSRGKALRPLTVPSCESVRRNFEEMIHLNDALAACQVEVHNSFLRFEEAIECYAEEAEVVCERERAYWEHVRVLEKEYNALRFIKRRIAKVQRAFRREEGVPIRQMHKNFIVVKQELGGSPAA